LNAVLERSIETGLGYVADITMTQRCETKIGPKTPRSA
jgi:hypothetical protein